MNDIEDRLREALGARAEAVRPHAGAHAENARRIRRARARRRITVPSAVAATAAAVAAPLALAGLPDGGADALDGGAGRPPGVPVDASTVVTIPTRLPGGATFRADAVGADGTVVGRTADGRVWRSGPDGGTPRRLGVRAAAGLTAGRGFTTWIAPGSEKLNCRTASGRTRAIDDQGAAAARPVLADGGVIVGSDVMDQPFVAAGCGAAGKTLENPRGSLGYAKALAYPTLFTVDPLDEEHGLREVDVRTSEITRRHPLPDGVGAQKPAGKPTGTVGKLKRIGPDGRSTNELTRVEGPLTPEPAWRAVANDRYFAWAAGGTLRIVDRTTWRQVLGANQARRPTAGQAAAARLTAGDHAVAYTVAGVATVWDTRSMRPSMWRGEAFAAGDWLLWRDGGDYRLGKVR